MGVRSGSSCFPSNRRGSRRLCLTTVVLRPIESLCAKACQFKRSWIAVVVVDGDAAVVLLGSRKMPPKRMVARKSAAANNFNFLD